MAFRIRRDADQNTGNPAHQLYMVEVFGTCPAGEKCKLIILGFTLMVSTPIINSRKATENSSYSQNYLRFFCTRLE